MSESESNKDTMMVIAKIVIISVVAALLLGITYVPTSEQLKVNEANAKTEILAKLIPGDVTFEAVEGTAVDAEGNPEILYYRATDASGNIVGYAFFKEQAGAQGPIVVAGAVDPTFTTLLGMSVLSNEETPGLGAKIVQPEFQNQFLNLPMASLALSKSGGSIDAITGATISSTAVVDALNIKIDEIKQAEE
ncbi:electron transport complex protein RnfG [Methanolobus vulcani]|jgi:electron transport complex protein RnfG|uniref:Ion-translocating oxidoreductase complex subunit G n=1 Tax=Methanolobus vulcani TaxID=38026 RepID=A0A7Z7AYC6_9EURY|nr:Rnf electron transport complex subunit RnfG [Methanolobus vulcani]MDK2825564.1 H+/Na+-translocating ferredoxin:NAD+ oxidoreductase subunit [Methanolobus sp.]MDK2947349.1 H+/Na+-translocating ferredoxin:NAD+ oxidoreductase subunit [Methanolobus sp.]SDF68021.1 electron transport complex protein RnfG [Methanolobus vulcani]